MPRLKSIGRRKFLLFSSVTGLFVLAGFGVSRRSTNLIMEFLAGIGTKVPARWVDSMCVNSPLVGRSENELIGEAYKTLDLPKYFITREHIHNAVERKIQTDIESGSLMRANNWLLTKTEAKLYCLSYLYINLD